MDQCQRLMSSRPRMGWGELRNSNMAGVAIS
jgi:hypothetical protein